jgi:hypothetical protein
LELLSRRAPGLGKEKGGAVGSGRGRKGVEKLWPAGGGLDGGAPHDRDGGLVTCARTASSGFYSPGEQARLQASTAKGVPRASMPWYGERRWLACAQWTCDGPQDNTSGDYDAVRGRNGAARVPRRQARRGPAALASRWWEPGPHGRQGRRGALRRRSRARPSCFSTGQPSVDRDSLQKVELCDKNGRYKSCR